MSLLSQITPRRRAALVAEAPRAVNFKFSHGLGDCCYAAHLVPLYVRRGFQIEVECGRDKAILFEAAGAKVIEAAQFEHQWGYPIERIAAAHGCSRLGSKIGHNISEWPLPSIGPKDDVWDEYCSERIDIRPWISPEVTARVRGWLRDLPRPITLLHSKGTTAQERKSLPDDVTARFYEEFLNQCDGTLIILDWHNRVPRIHSRRVRHLGEFGQFGAGLPTPPNGNGSLEELLALYLEADLMIGVDSGPLHLARFTSIPTIGIWRPGHYCQTYTLPRAEQLNVVLREHTRQWNRYLRMPWQIYEHPGDTFDAGILADLASRMLSSPRYLSALGTIAQDVQLQQFVDLTRCPGTSPKLHYWDRNRSLDILLRETAARFPTPTIVETGTIRSEEDWPGAGFATYLLGTFVHRHGGRLHSVDLDPRNVSFSRAWTACFGDRVTVHRGDSLEFLRSFGQAVDVAYLDSLDTDQPGHAAHCLRELQAILPRLHERSLVAIDDTPFQDGRWIGKGAEAVPWALQNGWKLLYASYQVTLERDQVSRVT